MFNYHFIFALTMTLLMGVGHCQNTLTQVETSILQGMITIEPTRPFEDAAKIQPGTPVKLKLTIENKGQHPNPEGQAYIKFGYAKPLENLPNSVIFQTEKLAVPSLEPGKKAELAFTTTHTMATLFDFVRFDWSMREYQAVVEIEKDEKIIGTLAITVSAYYYPGVKKDLPNEFPAL